MRLTYRKFRVRRNGRHLSIVINVLVCELPHRFLQVIESGRRVGCKLEGDDVLRWPLAHREVKLLYVVCPRFELGGVSAKGGAGDVDFARLVPPVGKVQQLFLLLVDYQVALHK